MSEFRQKIVNRVLLILGIFVFVNFYGTIGFMLIDELPFWEAVYLNGVTYSTVGFGDVVPHSPMGRAFAVSVALGGLLFSGISVGLFVQLLYEDTLLQIFKGSKMEKSISNLNNHFIVCGRGDTGNQLISELQERGYKVVVIDQNEDCQQDTEFFILGDARRDSVLKKAAINQAKGLAAVLTNDADNVFITLTARHMNPDLKIVSRFKDPDSEKKLMIAGADFVTSPYRIGGHRLALSLASPILLSFLDEAMNQTKLGVQFGNIVVPEGSRVKGKAIKDSGIRENSMGALIVGLTPAKGQPLFNPQAEYVLQDGCQLLVLGTQEQLTNLKKYIGNAD